MAGALWPDVREDSARASLRNALTAARRALGDDGARHLVATRDRVGLGPPDEVEVDVRRAAALAAAGRHAEAAALLDGDLLPGLDADWVHDARDRHRAARAEVLAAQAAARSRPSRWRRSTSPPPPRSSRAGRAPAPPSRWCGRCTTAPAATPSA